MANKIKANISRKLTPDEQKDKRIADLENAMLEVQALLTAEGKKITGKRP